MNIGQAKICVKIESPKRGVFPNGSYHSSNSIDNNFFTREAKNTCYSKLIEEDVPFLYQLIYSKLMNRIKPNPQDQKNAGNEPDCSDTDSNHSDDSADDVMDMEFDRRKSSTVKPGRDHKKKSIQTRREKRACMVCSDKSNDFPFFVLSKAK
jgi:hypothetical protein